MTLSATPPPSLVPESVELELDKPLPSSLRTVALGQFNRLDGALRMIGDDPDVAVHTARKTMKRLRGLIRLVRDEVGHRAYREENVVLRDTGRRLAPVRDSLVLIGTLDRICDDYRGMLAPDAFAAARAHLVARHDRESRAVLGDRRLLTGIVVTVKTARARFAAWDGSGPPGSGLAAGGVPDDFTAIARGLHRVYRRGRSGMQHAYESGTEAGFHEWRKRVKYLRYQMETLLPLWPEMIGAQATALDRLGEVLGEEHDLAVLEEIVRHDDLATADQRERTVLLTLLHRSRLEHQWQARSLGRALYGEKPDAFVARIGGYWAAARPA